MTRFTLKTLIRLPVSFIAVDHLCALWVYGIHRCIWGYVCDYIVYILALEVRKLSIKVNNTRHWKAIESGPLVSTCACDGEEFMNTLLHV